MRGVFVSLLCSAPLVVALGIAACSIPLQESARLTSGGLGYSSHFLDDVPASDGSVISRRSSRTI